MTSAGAERHVVLLGLMGTGKTSVGRRVAERLGRPLLDRYARLYMGEASTPT